jgi:hypothetical protein
MPGTPVANRERGGGRVYRRRDLNDPKRLLKVWRIDYHVDGKRYRESSKSQRKTDAVALLKRRMGEHATGQYVGPTRSGLRSKTWRRASWRAMS